MPPPLLIDPTELDFEHPLADVEAIRRVNPQRHELEQLTAILFIDREGKLIVGYKDVREDEFWVRGHMPGFALLPGVLICEAAAQLCSYYIAMENLLSGDFTAFGGMDKVKFRDAVRPGDRLVMVSHALEIRTGRRASFDTQGIVDGNLIFQGIIVGMPFLKSRQKIGGASQQQAEAL